MKQIIRLTEGDLHRIIENCVRKALNEDWTKAYDKWADNIGMDKKESNKLFKQWSQELKDEYGDKRGLAFDSHSEKKRCCTCKEISCCEKKS